MPGGIQVLCLALAFTFTQVKQRAGDRGVTAENMERHNIRISTKIIIIIITTTYCGATQPVLSSASQTTL